MSESKTDRTANDKGVVSADLLSSENLLTEAWLTLTDTVEKIDKVRYFFKRLKQSRDKLLITEMSDIFKELDKYIRTDESFYVCLKRLIRNVTEEDIEAKRGTHTSKYK